jgi:hypothetical protein
MIPQITSTSICYHDKLDRKLGLTIPPPANILVCKCGQNKLCPACGWHELVGVCACDPPPHKLSFHNDGGSGTSLNYVPQKEML